jgi:hypothetical protein
VRFCEHGYEFPENIEEHILFRRIANKLLMINLVLQITCNEFYTSCQMNRLSCKSEIPSLEFAYCTLLYLKHICYAFLLVQRNVYNYLEKS